MDMGSDASEFIGIFPEGVSELTAFLPARPHPPLGCVWGLAKVFEPRTMALAERTA
jgi:hypothetical protein